MILAKRTGLLAVFMFATLGCQQASHYSVPPKVADPAVQTQFQPAPPVTPIVTTTLRPPAPTPVVTTAPTPQPIPGRLIGQGAGFIRPSAPIATPAAAEIEVSGARVEGSGLQPLDDPEAPVVRWFSGLPSPSILSLCNGACVREAPADSKAELCSPVIVEQPVRAKVKALDLLFIVDTSDSMDITRAKVADEIGHFIERLPPGSSVNIGVMAAHGPDSSDRLEGVLFSESLKTASRPNDDLKVLKFPQMKIADIKQRLHRKMTILSKYRDDSRAQGEMGLMSLYRALTQTENADALRSQGLLRADAALAVVFISDEQDVCYDYKKGECPQFNGTCQQDPIEISAKDAYCHIDKFAANSRNIQPADLREALQGVSSTLIVSGIHYLSNESIPKSDKTDRWGQEHEKGLGYLDLITLMHGTAVNLADHNNIGKNLMSVADFSNFRMMSYIPTINIHPEHQGQALANIQVSVIYADGKEAVISDGAITYDGRGTVTISEEELFKKMKPGSKLRLVYRPQR